MDTLTPSDKPETQTLSGRLHWYHWLVVIGSLVLTFAWYLTSQQAQEKNAERFHFQANQIVQLVKERMGKYEEALWSGVAALQMMPVETDRKQWKVFADNLSIASRYPGINGIGVIHAHTKASLPAYLAWQRETLPDYAIHPAHNKHEFWPITYIEPIDNNRKAVGLDMAHEVNRYTAIMKARDTGLAQITGPIVLVQDSKKTPGFLFYAPWYQPAKKPQSKAMRQQEMKGAVYAPFIVKKLMDGMLENKNRLVNFSIADGNDELYSELSNSSEDYDPNPLFRTTITVDLYGRPWQFDIQTSRIFREQHTRTHPLMILTGGLVIDSLLLVLFLLLASTNKRAVRYANEVTTELQASTETLEGVYNRLSRAMDTMMDGLVVISKDGVIQEVNNAILKTFGYEKTALIGKNVSCLMPEPYASEHDTYLNDYHSRGETKNGVLNTERQLTGKRADGSTFPIRLTVSKGHNASGPFFTGVIHDLSSLNASEMALAEKESILKAAMASSSTGLYITDVIGHFIEVNCAFSNFLGYESSELVGRHFMEFLPNKPDKDGVGKQRSTYKDTSESPCREQEYLHKSGHIVWGLLSASTVNDSDGILQFTVAQIADISQQKTLAGELSKKNSALEETNRELNQFAYIASHDLKEPLRTLRTFTGYLLKDLENEKWDRVAQDVYYLEDSAQRMTHLVNDLLELSRTSNTEFHMNLIPSDELLELVQKNLKAQINDTDCALEILGSPLMLLGDKGQLCQVLQNLINNAIKYHRPNERPKVTISVEPSDDPHFGLVHITDSGIGIADEHCDTIFLAFKKLHGLSEYSGTGIGLAIVKKIVDRHQGTITVQSKLGVGSTFSLRLPLYLR